MLYSLYNQYNATLPTGIWLTEQSAQNASAQTETYLANAAEGFLNLGQISTAIPVTREYWYYLGSGSDGVIDSDGAPCGCDDGYPAGNPATVNSNSDTDYRASYCVLGLSITPANATNGSDPGCLDGAH
jgi:hypothetical protein